MKKHFNYYLFFLIVFLVGFSLLFAACLSGPVSLQRFGSANYYFLRQVLLGFLPAIVVGVIGYKIPLKFLQKWAPFFVVANLALLFVVFIPGIGTRAGGASRWINFGFGSIQPSEFLKITAILYLSAWIASRLAESGSSDWKNATKRSYHNIIHIFVPFIIFLGLITFALFLQKDASTLGIISITLLTLYFSAKTPLWHTGLVVMAGISFLLLIVKFEPYRLDRWLIFLNPDVDPLGKGYQLRQSLISLGSGGIFGKGLGMSVQKFNFLPQAIMDSIFAVMGEEFGVIGGIAVVAAFILLFWLGLQIAKKSSDKFASTVAVGIVVWITLQAFINISSSAGIFPLAGIPLPFFSFGGSHLMIELFAMGLLLNISKNT
jgi:cell division protein FtsW